MADQTVILVDERDRKLGYKSRNIAHSGRGIRHRAFVTLLFDSQNNVLLHKRKHRLFDGLWDLTAISHPLHKAHPRGVQSISKAHPAGEKRNDETYQEASDRALKKEMGIGHVEVNKVGAFNYTARDGKNSENEYCAVLVGTYDGKFKPNKAEVYDVLKIGYEDFMKDIKKNPKKYTPWARLAAKQLVNSSWFIVHSQNEFQKELKSFLKVFEPYAEKYFDKKIKEASKYSPLIKQFYVDLADFSQGGKRLRGYLVYLGFQTGPVGGKGLKQILSICLAFEIMHSFLLIHDDIMDKSDMRRGKMTIHKRYEKLLGAHYGMSQAIVLGDIACLEAFKLAAASSLDSNLKTEVIDKLTEVLLETCYGQALDVANSHKKASLADIWKVTDLKTAGYSFVGPLTVGAIIGGALKNKLAPIEKYGEAVGKAFQIQDDILGVFGDEKVLGKSVLSDMREGKKTLLVEKARGTKGLWDKAGKDRKGLWGNEKSNMKELEQVREAIKSSGALEWCEREKEKLMQSAIESAKKMTRDKNLREVFIQVARYAGNRTA